MNDHDDQATLLAGAIAYAADTYAGTRDLAGTPADRWELLHDSDKAACLHKARVVLEGAGVVR